MLSLHTRIIVHLSQHPHAFNGSETQGLGSRRPSGDEVDGMEHDSSDTLAPEPRRKGGLMQSGNVSLASMHGETFI